MNSDIEVKDYPEVKIMSIRLNIDFRNMSGTMAETYKELYNYVKEHDGDFNGQCFAVYHGLEFDPENIDVECGFGVNEYVAENDRIKQSKIKKNLCASTFHKGSYHELGKTYEALLEWVDAHGYEVLDHMYDIYLNNPDEVGEENSEVETVWPVKKTVKVREDVY